nr:GHKL domain-containing protein [Bacteroidales bacterium]
DYSQKLILQKNKLDSGNKFLFKQKKQMDLQHTQILKQNSVLKQQGSKIQKQRNLVYLLVIIIFLTVLLAISIWNSYRNIRKFNKELNQRVLDRTKELHVLNEQLNIELNERKLAEIEIQKLNQTLEQRVAERTNQLKVINKELESFSYSISHDLRAPLRAIFGFSQILSRRHKDSLNEEGQQYMNYIVEASVRMEQLINDLLNYSRLGRKSLDLHPVSLKLILNNIYTDFKQKFDEIGANFKVSDNLPDINGDETLLMQIFINLIENAITYRRTAVPLMINIDCEQNQANVIIKVSDNGIGIPQEYWEKIFNIFQRLHSEDEYPGTGIGLATVKKAVSMLNGTISVESVVDAGSVFIINFPLYSKSLQNE